MISCHKAQSSLEGPRRVWMMMSRSMLTALLPHGVHMVYVWITHGLQSRMHSRSVVIAWTTYNSIYRVTIQQRLLVKFSCDPHIDSLLRALLVRVTIGLCVQWLPQHLQQNRGRHNICGRGTITTMLSLLQYESMDRLQGQGQWTRIGQQIIISLQRTQGQDIGT